LPRHRQGTRNLRCHSLAGERDVSQLWADEDELRAERFSFFWEHAGWFGERAALPAACRRIAPGKHRRRPG